MLYGEGGWGESPPAAVPGGRHFQMWRQERGFFQRWKGDFAVMISCEEGLGVNAGRSRILRLLIKKNRSLEISAVI